MMLGPTKQRSGIGTEVLAGLVQASFETFGLERLRASYHADNVAAERLFATCGFDSIGCAESAAESSVQVVQLTIERWRARTKIAQIAMSRG